MKSVMVSVIIPVYNVEKYLKECLDSILNQNLESYEVICIDDNSADNSCKILNDYMNKYENLHVIFNKSKIGPAVARNKGLSMAKGKYVIFLDSDDYFSLNLLVKCYTAMEEKSLDVLLYGCERVDYSGDTIGRIPVTWIPFRNEFRCFKYCDLKEIFPFESISNITWNRMVRREFLLDNQLEFQDLPCSNDTYIGYMEILLAERIGLLKEEEPLVYYRVGRTEQISANHNSINYYKAIVKVKQELIDRGQWETYKEDFLYRIFVGDLRGQICVCNDERKKAFWNYFKENIRKDFEEIESIPSELKFVVNEYLEGNLESRILEISKMNLSEIVRFGNKIIPFFMENKNKRIAIWGLGNRGKALYLNLLHNNIFADYYVDKNVEKVDKDFFKEVTIQGTLQEPVDIIVATNEYIYNDLKIDKKYGDTEIVLLDIFFN